jgi:hypothetical protein
MGLILWHCWFLQSVQTQHRPPRSHNMSSIGFMMVIDGILTNDVSNHWTAWAWNRLSTDLSTWIMPALDRRAARQFNPYLLFCADYLLYAPKAHLNSYIFFLKCLQSYKKPLGCRTHKHFGLEQWKTQCNMFWGTLGRTRAIQTFKLCVETLGCK